MGIQTAMNKLINALFWGLFLFDLAVCCLKDKAIELLVVMCFYALIAVCSAWCWVTEKSKGDEIQTQISDAR